MIETQSIEYKITWRDEYVKWICGFAYAQGGILVIGKYDTGKITGSTDSKKLLDDIPNKVSDVRGKHWAGVPLLYVKDAAAFSQFRKRGLESKRISTEMLRESDISLLEKLHLRDGQYLKRAAVLLFHSEPDAFITGAFVKIGYFRSDNDILYQDEIHGNLFTQVDGTLELLTTKYLKATIKYSGVQRREELPVPEEALREAILNALTHKDYASGTPVQISVYDDKILIWNPGYLPENWTIENLLHKHASRPFNPDIANVFFRAGMIEAWGRGIDGMIESCTNIGLTAPVFRLEGSGLWVEMTFRNADTIPNTIPNTILTLLRENSTITQSQIASVVNLSLIGVKYHMNKLIRSGIIRHIGSTRTGRWEVHK
jgi:ATP-dependent DNA helicase RecG